MARPTIHTESWNCCTVVRPSIDARPLCELVKPIIKEQKKTNK